MQSNVCKISTKILENELVVPARNVSKSISIIIVQNFERVLQNIVHDRVRSNLKLFYVARPDNINAKNNEGKTPIHYLAETKFLDDAEMKRTSESYESQFKQDYHQVLPRLSLEMSKLN